MMWPWRFLRVAIRTLKRVLTGEVVRQIDLEIAGGLGALSWRLKREKRSGREYVVLAANNYYYVFELGEFDRFISAADMIRASQASAASLDAAPKSGHLVNMVLTGEVLRRVDTTICEGQLEMSFRLKRDKTTLDEHIVFAATAPGWHIYHPFELAEFHRFIAAAKRLRAASRGADLDASRP